MDDAGEKEKRMKLKVYIRLRPIPGDNPNGICDPEPRVLYIKDPVKGHTSEFVFDKIFDATAKQETIYDETVKSHVDAVLAGYNACCFAYGQTGSGKTYSMFGKESGEWDLRGVIPRSCEQLFSKIASLQRSGSVKFTVYMSMTEIYLEQVSAVSDELYQT
jgi:hypothetical protein